MGVGLRCWPTNQDYNNGKDCSASIATYAHEAAGAPDGEMHCSADSLHKGGAAAVAAADSESPPEDAYHASIPQVQLQSSACSAGSVADTCVAACCRDHSRHCRGDFCRQRRQQSRAILDKGRHAIFCQTGLLLAQVKAEKTADSEEMRGMTAAAFSSAPSSSSPQPLRIPTDHPSQIYSPFQSQQQQHQHQLPTAQQPAMMELSAHSGPPSLHQHLDIMGECSCPILDKPHGKPQHCR